MVSEKIMINIIVDDDEDDNDNDADGRRIIPIALGLLADGLTKTTSCQKSNVRLSLNNTNTNGNK